MIRIEAMEIESSKEYIEFVVDVKRRVVFARISIVFFSQFVEHETRL